MNSLHNRRWWLLLLVVAAPAGFAWATGNIWEDFFITYRSSLNLLHGHGLVFEIGRRVHTFTSPLGTLLPAGLAGLARTDDPLVVMALFRVVAIAALGALAFSKWYLGKVSPMLWLSTVLIVGFGTLTIYFQDERFIQWKPTIIYVGFGVLLIGGWLKGKALLKVLLEAAFDGLSEEGWLKLSFNWGLFFLFLAGLNTALMYSISFEDWLAAKLWLFLPLSFLFTFTQLPMLLRHGLSVDDKAEVLENPPSE